MRKIHEQSEILLQKEKLLIEEERKRISRTLHDCVTQQLIGILLETRNLPYIESKSDLKQKIQGIEQSILSTIDQLKNISIELREPLIAEHGLKKALQFYFDQSTKQLGIKIHFTSNITVERFGDEIDTSIYRICQEAILNAYKYAQVDQLQIQLNKYPGSLELFVIDEGRGFNTSNVSSGLGIIGMKERAVQINAHFSIYSKLGSGTIVHVVVPLR